MKNPHLDIDRISDEYGRDGVTRVRGFFPAALISEVKAALDRYIKETVPDLPPGDCIYESDGVSVRNLFRMEHHDQYFSNLARLDFVHDLVSRLVHGEPELIQVETFNKPARTGSGVPWHQDNAYFCLAPPDAITVWIAIDPATIENGAVYYLRGRQEELLPHTPSGVTGNSMGLAQSPDVPLEEQFCGDLEPGDALLHHCQIPHRSDPNTTGQSRCGFLMVFRGTHTKRVPTLAAEYRQAHKTP